MGDPITNVLDDNGVIRDLKEGIDFTVSESGLITLTKPLRKPKPEIDDKGERAVIRYTTSFRSVDV